MGDHQHMAREQAKVLRHLHEIHERERALLPQIEAQLKAAPPGGYQEQERFDAIMAEIPALADAP